MMLSIKKRLKLFVLLGCMFFAASMNAATNDDLISLEAEMLKYIDDLGEYVRFSITDTSNTDAEEDNGRFTDMNINICQSISRLLHGRIWRDTEYTNGIRFIFEIPTNSITDNNTN